jgi:hypothetical protein
VRPEISNFKFQIANEKLSPHRSGESFFIFNFSFEI